MNWIAIDPMTVRPTISGQTVCDNGVFVSVGLHDFFYKNTKTNEETCYGFDVLEGVATPIGTRKHGVSEKEILLAIQKWLPSKYSEEQVSLDYKQSRQKLSQAWNDDAKFLMRMAKSLAIPYRLRGAEITEYLSSADNWDAVVSGWRHNAEYHKQLSKKQDYLTTFLSAQNKILSALLWLQKNRKLIEGVINYQKDIDSFYYEVLLALPVQAIRKIAIAQIEEKRYLTDTPED
jgi:hypothetical protein